MLYRFLIFFSIISIILILQRNSQKVELAKKILSDKSCVIADYRIEKTPFAYSDYALYAIYECDSVVYDLDFDLSHYVNGRYIDVRITRYHFA